MQISLVLVFCTLLCHLCAAQIKPGIEQLFKRPYIELLYEKRVGLITNQTGIDSHSNSAISLLQKHAESGHYILSALFGPEHGLFGIEYAGEHVNGEKHRDQIPVYSLHSKDHRLSVTHNSPKGLLPLACPGISYSLPILFATQVPHLISDR